jgi:hypothetical protein
MCGMVVGILGFTYDPWCTTCSDPTHPAVLFRYACCGLCIVPCVRARESM